MKRQFMRGTFNILFVLAGTVVVFATVAIATSLVSGRTPQVHATTEQTVPTIAPQPPLPTDTVPPKVGELIQNIAIEAHNPGTSKSLSMRVTDAAPVITQQEAQQIALDAGYPFAMGGVYEDREVTVNAVYGLLTHGQPADTSGLRMGDGVSPVAGPCKGWIGPCDWPVHTCRAGVCQDTGKRIGRIQNRPYWLLDYGNIISERQACSGCPKQTFNHVVLLVDAQDKFVLSGYSYTAP